MNSGIDNPMETKKPIDKRNIIYTRNDIHFALAMLLCGFLYWNLIRLPGLGAGVTLFAAIFCLCTFIYLKSGEVRQTKTSLLCFVVKIGRASCRERV